MRAFVPFLLLSAIHASAVRADDPSATTPPPARRIEVSLTETGFEPSPIRVAPGDRVELVVPRRSDKTCARELIVAGQTERHELPLGKAVVVPVQAPASGEVRYACAMDMVRGVIVVEAPKERTIAVAVTEKGFEPAEIVLTSGETVRLVVTRKTDKTCARDILIPALGVRHALPLNEAVEVNVGPTQPGKLQFGCAMNGMIGGVLVTR